MIHRWGWWVCEATAITEDPDDFEWCGELFGTPSANGRWFYEFQSNKFYFKYEADAMWFELKWS